MMQGSAFTDPDEYPEDDVIASRLGDAAGAFTALLEALAEEYPDFSATWKYYRDGKSWLMKSAVRGKTLFWTMVSPGVFSASFFLGEKDEGAVEASALSARAKKAFAESAGKKFRSISLEIRKEKDIKQAMILAAIKNPQKGKTTKGKVPKGKNP